MASGSTSLHGAHRSLTSILWLNVLNVAHFRKFDKEKATLRWPDLPSSNYGVFGRFCGRGSGRRTRCERNSFSRSGVSKKPSRDYPTRRGVPASLRSFGNVRQSGPQCVRAPGILDIDLALAGISPSRRGLSYASELIRSMFWIAFNMVHATPTYLRPTSASSARRSAVTQRDEALRRFQFSAKISF
jgi:hypothetical protein